MGLGIFDAEELQSSVHDSLLSSSYLRSKLGNLVSEVLELALKSSSLSLRISACQGGVRVRINILLNATNTAIKLVGLTSVTAIENVIFLKVLLISKVHGIQENLLLLNLLF